MRWLSLDLARRFGWSLTRQPKPLHGSELLLNGTIDGRIAQAQSKLWDWLTDMRAATNPDGLAWEAPIMIGGRSHGTERFLMALASTAALFAYRHALRPLEANVNTVRAQVCGHGHCGKEGAYAWCIAQGLRPVDDNDADALVLLEFAERQTAKLRQGEPQRRMAV